MTRRTAKPDTILTHAGRHPERHHGTVNMPVYRASTILFPTLDAFEGADKGRFDSIYYGRFGTPTTFALEEALAALDGAHRALALPSGLAAVAVSLLTFLKTGDHLLMTDAAYGPTRAFCRGMLQRMGIETTFYDPCIGAGIGALVRENTRVIYMESPGSLTFEVQDVPAIVAVARSRGVATILDNTWATPLFFPALKHGIDAVVLAATKYIVGHSDAMLGAILCSEASSLPVRRTAAELGYCASPDDCFLGLRGLRTLGVRLRHHQDQGLCLARWLQARPEIKRVLHPALPDDPGHALWRRDFAGASGLFGIVLHDVPRRALAAMLDGMRYFGMGASWGAYESQIMPANPARQRTATTWDPGGPTVRIHAGLEDPEDLLADLEAGLARLAAAC